jgi:hypothetical protein
MSDAIAFIRAVADHWRVVVMGSLTFALFGAWERWQGGAPWWIPLTLFIGALLYATFLAWRDEHRKANDAFDQSRAALAFRNVLKEAIEMWRLGTVECANGTEADAWGPRYDAWVQSAKDLITRDAGPEERDATFLIGNLDNVPTQRGQNAEHTRRLTCLHHHTEQLKDGLRRYLPSERRK